MNTGTLSTIDATMPRHHIACGTNESDGRLGHSNTVKLGDNYGMLAETWRARPMQHAVPNLLWAAN